MGYQVGARGDHVPARRGSAGVHHDEPCFDTQRAATMALVDRGHRGSDSKLCELRANSGRSTHTLFGVAVPSCPSRPRRLKNLRFS